MKKLETGVIAAGLAAALAATSIVPADAAPLFLPKAVTAQSDVVQVRDGVRWRRGWNNGYRGYRNYRPGYRYDNGWWFPAGALVAGALIGGAIANNNYYGGYYGGGYVGGYYPDYYAPPRVYAAPPGASYRAGYRAGYRDGLNGRYYGKDIRCIQRLQDAGKC